MRFFVDINLPPMLAAWLQARGHAADHASVLLSPTADDREIWALAVEADAIVITKDQDYLDLAAGRGGARVVLLRCGNLKLGPFRVWVEARWPEVEELLGAGETVVEVE